MPTSALNRAMLLRGDVGIAPYEYVFNNLNL